MDQRKYRLALICILAVLLAVVPASARGAKGGKETRGAKEVRGVKEVKEVAKDAALPCTNYISVVADTGLVIGEFKADETHAPASMIKMMLMVLVAEGLDASKWQLDTPITISANAASIGGTAVKLLPKETFTLNQLMSAVAVASANNAAMAVAEGLWGSADTCLAAANEKAKILGMTHTTIHSVHGLPPAAGQLPDETTARDMATLAIQCLHHPQIMQWVGLHEVALRQGEVPKQTTNKLLLSFPGCDGLKTGYTRAAGFCITATAVRDGIRLLTVVMGCPLLAERFQTAHQLLEQGFASTTRVRVIAKGDLVDPVIPLANAKVDKTQLAASEDIWVIVPSQDVKQLKIVASSPARLRAPLQAGDVQGKVHVDLAGKTLGEVTLVVPQTIEEPGWRWKLTHGVLNRVQHEGTAQGG